MFEEVSFGDGALTGVLIMVGVVIALVVFAVLVRKFGPRLLGLLCKFRWRWIAIGFLAVILSGCVAALIMMILSDNPNATMQNLIYFGEGGQTFVLISASVIAAFVLIFSLVVNRSRLVGLLRKFRWRRIAIGLLLLLLSVCIAAIIIPLSIGKPDATMQDLVHIVQAKLVWVGAMDEPDCDDGNPCTDEHYDVESGECIRTYNTHVCDDGNRCTFGDRCVEGTCIAPDTDNCDDGDPCTTDTCDPESGCEHTNNSTASCDDGDMCTENDTCLVGECVGGERVTCDDDNVCTDDSCDSKTGKCVHTNNTADCLGGDKCWEYATCRDGECHGKKIVCDDGNPHTDDSCDPDEGCQHQPIMPERRTRKAKAPKAKKPKKPRSTANLKCIPKDGCPWSACRTPSQRNRCMETR